ncbi:MAG TPA: ATP-binding protein [Rhodocyclaceae bacterium]|nr:ATP-binding protein [Rhodocyclaceae bacterium]
MSAAHDAILLAGAEELLMLVDPATLAILAVNPAAERLLGLRAEALVGQPVTEIECALADLFFWEEVRSGGGADEQVMEGLYRRADGTLLSARKCVRRVPAGMLVRATDIGAQKKAETELALMTAQLRATLEATADGILVIDADGRVVNMNRRLARQWQLPETLLAHRDDDALIAHMAAALESPAPFRSLLTDHLFDLTDTFDTFVFRDGRRCEITSRPARQAEQVIGRVFCFTDVTERHRSQQALIAARDAADAANRAKSDFLAIMSHEIRTPMNGIIGMAQLLGMSEHRPEEREYIDTILTSSDALMGIINDILDYSKIEARKLTLERISFDLHQLVTDVERMFRPKALEKGLQFGATLATTLPRVVMGDPTRLRQILVNLVSNAFKFTPQGAIRIDVEPAEALRGGRVIVRFAVTDTGIGIPGDKCEHIFTPFEQADMSTTRRYGGTGLGLAICRMLCTLMEGEIRVDSQVGAGSRFDFSVALDVGVAEERPTVEPPRALLRRDTRILIAEDNPVNQVVLARLLSRLGATQPAFARDGREAVDLGTADRYDLIFMDARMPVMSGIEATHALRERGCRAYIVGCSADTLPDDIRLALDAGMDDYLTKPVSHEALGAAIERWRRHLGETPTG